MFSNVIKCLEQNILKEIDCKRPSNTKQVNRVQNVQIEIWKYKAVRKYKIQPDKVRTFSLCFCFFVQVDIKLYLASLIQSISKISTRI